MDQIAISRIAKGILSILFFIAGMLISGTVLGGVIGLSAAWLTTLLLFDIPRAVVLAKHRVEYQNAPMEVFWPVWNTRQLKKLFMLSLPVGITVMLVSLSVNIPRYFVEAWQGEAVLGIFGPMSYFIVLGNEVVLALGQSAAPRMARYYVHGDRTSAIRLLLRQKAVGASFGLAGVVTVAVAGPWILSLSFGSEYAQHSRVFLLLMMSSGVSLISGFSSMFLTAARAFWIQIPVRVCSVSTMAICCALLVPSHGIVGAAAAMLISTLVHAALALSATIFILYRMPNAGKDADLPRTLMIQNAST
jgi:O-antigen/teichoic acid export membrane protein